MAEAKVNEAQLMAAVRVLKDLSPDKLEDAYLALEAQHGADVVERARALLAVEQRAAAITADLKRHQLKRHRLKRRNGSGKRNGRSLRALLNPLWLRLGRSVEGR